MGWLQYFQLLFYFNPEVLKEGILRVANRHTSYHFTFQEESSDENVRKATPVAKNRTAGSVFLQVFNLEAAQILAGLEYIPQKLNASLVAGGPRSYQVTTRWWPTWAASRSWLCLWGGGSILQRRGHVASERLEARNLAFLQFRPLIFRNRSCPVDGIFFVALERCLSKTLMIWNSLFGNPITFNLLLLEPYDLDISFIFIAQDVVVRCKPLVRNADWCFVSVSLAMCWCSPLFMLGFEMTMSHMQLTQRCKTKCVHSHSDFCFQKWRGWNGAHFPPYLLVPCSSWFTIHVLAHSCRTLGDRTGLSPCSSLPLATTSDHPSDGRSYRNPMSASLHRRSTTLM